MFSILRKIFKWTESFHYDLFYKYFYDLFVSGIVVILHILDWPKNCPEIVSREAWGADPAVVVEYAIFPVKYAIIHHTVTSTCNSLEACSEFVKGVQYFHMEDMEFHDIGYK